jgi:hypothetical protein
MRFIWQFVIQGATRSQFEIIALSSMRNGRALLRGN